ncbi:MAG: hypothetical protein HGA45_03130 [Chloroflexales bacterium]|nr:hypothetical protein [Chloroflexales bacterium]
MSAPLLTTKLYLPPPRTNVVPRAHLIARLDTALSRALTLISAPAGFGKTTLLSAWLAGCGRPAAWLSLDAADSDPARFLTYLVAALQTLDATVGAGVVGVLQSPQLPPVEALLTVLLNEIAALPGRLVLALDDYHVIDSPAVDQALAFLIEHLPPQLHLVIATREDPHLPLARLRARSQLTELRATDLRFTPAEAAAFLTQVMGLNLADSDIAALETRTEGWIAGLQLAAISMQGQPDTTGFITSFTGSHRFVLDYLIEEVLGRQPEPIQVFLLRTSILDRMCGPLCDAVLASPAASGQATLEQLDHTNLFIVPLDNERHWYRYHHLFGDLLRQRLGKPQELADLHLRASQWYEENGDLGSAFRHASAAGDSVRAARLAETAWQGMDRTFQTAAWLGWVKQLPQAVVCSRPRLCVQLGWAVADAGAPEASESHLQNAERALAGATDQDESRALPGAIALIRATNAQIQGNLAEAVTYAELAIQLIPEDDGFLHAQAAITLELTHWASGNLEAALRAMQVWIDTMQRLGNQTFAIASAFAVADMHVIMGQLGEAEQALRQAIQQAAALGRETEAVTTHHHLGLALLAHERGDAAAATRHLHTAAALGQHSTLVDWPYRWKLAQARLKEAAREWDAALALLDEAGRVYVKNPVPILQPVAAQRARVYLKQGRLDKAQAWLRERGISTEDAVRYLDEYDLLTLARVRLAEGTFDGVGDLLERLLALAEAQKRTGSVIEILVVQALVHHAQRNRPQALAALRHALSLAEPEGYIRIFVDEGPPMVELLERMKDEGGRMKEYIHTLLAAFDNDKESHPSSVIPHPLVEPLSERELEVLRMVAQGLSNRAISARLCLAVSTVKGHNQRIFDKLQVQSRTEAIVRARELGLV